EGRPHIVDLIKNDEIDFIVNTTEGKQAIADSCEIRRTGLQHRLTYTTTMTGARAMCRAMKQQSMGEVNRLQDLHKELVL
ncbi:MAG: carbamoyl-phosphate synthase large subunit, partial [Halothiobacillaceae bacterium]